ncbi:D-2-hydroxyacid dehydrogenase [Rhodopirellula sp. MGV]|uniref:D-2-hydroxyacid dehydrogenase n=1 Tax=Rhodopirellula sp. MGV TaxID=2023130 RepID=UPI000B960145|nr:D-2-hydroxyacid dehydrogenase [Rhodopirellula sp. MGV]OYP35436.1 phosphoglycerate dehydrogenase [Rhodopirellula sp. MGV]PNY33876.1 D-2-hydroxyacid dehydrogenase [Rhodopirellula baltica]
MRIVLCYPVGEKHIRLIQQAAPDAEVVNAGQERIDELLPTAEVFIGHAKVPVNWDRVLDAGKLRWIQSSAAGLDHCLVPGVIANDEITVSSASGLFAPQVAEQTFSLLFGVLRRAPLFFRAERKREFVRLPTDDLRGKTVGIVGLGGNGRVLAKMLSPWDVRIIATDYYPIDCPQEVDELWPADQLDRLLGESDIVILTLPLNRDTRGLFDAERFAKMKPGAYLINVARGAIVKESALCDALQSGQLAGAGLDVTEVEPLPEDSLLWDDPKVMISPHVGAQSYRRVDDSTNLAALNLKRYQAGLPVYNRVDKSLGFPHPSAAYRGEST